MTDRRTFLTSFAAAALAAGIAPASAADATRDGPAEIKARGTLRVGLTGDYRPYSYNDAAKGTWEGLDVDVARAMARDLGASLQIVKTSWPTMTADLVADTFDIAMGGVTRNADRAKAGLLSRAYVVDGKVALIRAADAGKYHTLADLDAPAVRVGLNPGGTNESFVRANLTHASVIMNPTNLAIPGGVAAGTYDVMITDGVEAALAARTDPRLAVMNASAPFTKGEKVYYLRAGDTPLLGWVDTWMRAHEADGTFTRLRTAWIGSNLNAPR